MASSTRRSAMPRPRNCCSTMLRRRTGKPAVSEQSVTEVLLTQRSAPETARSHALAFAANEHAGHGLGSVTGFAQRRVGTVPAGVVGVVAGGTSLAVAALAAGAAMQHDLVRPGSPVFVDKKFRRF